MAKREKLTNIVSVRVSEQEDHDLQSLADASNTTTSKLVRILIVELLTTPPTKKHYTL